METNEFGLPVNPKAGIVPARNYKIVRRGSPLMESLKALQDMTLTEVLTQGLLGFKSPRYVVTSNPKGEDIHSLALMSSPTEGILIPFSRGLKPEEFEAGIQAYSYNFQFYWNNKHQDGDEVDAPTGLPGLTIGRPSGSAVVEDKTFQDVIADATKPSDTEGEEAKRLAGLI